MTSVRSVRKFIDVEHNALTVIRNGVTYTVPRLGASDIARLQAQLRELEGKGLHGRFADEHAEISQTLRDQGITA